MASRKPDYRISCMDTETGAKSGPLGAAWKNADGSIALKLDPGVALVGGPKNAFRLFPTEGEEVRMGRPFVDANTMAPVPATPRAKSQPKPAMDDIDGDIPF